MITPKIEPIHTDEIHSPGYVWFRCDVYNLPDTTAGQIGYHVCYRPLCGDMYQGNELVTEQMREDLRAYYTEQKRLEEERKQAQREAEHAEHLARMAEIEAAPKITHKLDPATTWMGDASMDAEDSIF